MMAHDRALYGFSVARRDSEGNLKRVHPQTVTAMRDEELDHRQRVEEDHQLELDYIRRHEG